MLNGKCIDDVLKDVKRMGKKKAEIKKAVLGELSQADIFVIRECLETIAVLEGKINRLDSIINQRLEKEQKQGQMQILISISGIIGVRLRSFIGLLLMFLDRSSFLHITN